MKDGKRRTSERKLFPGYLLMEMEMDDQTRFLVTNTQGVSSFIGTTSGRDSGKIPSLCCRRTSTGSSGASSGSRRRSARRSRTRSGSRCASIDGPFSGFSGLIDEVDGERGKVKVMVSIFGRATPVELDFLQVEST